MSDSTSSSRIEASATDRRQEAYRYARLVGAAALCACSGWGPIEHLTARYVYGADSSVTRTAIAVPYIEEQSPTGFAAFPDGGSSRVLKRGMLVYLCTLSAPLQFLSFVPQPAGVSDNVDVRVLSWEANGFDVAFRQDDVRPSIFSAFHIDLTGVVHPLGVPADTVQASQVTTPACQRTVDSLNLQYSQPPGRFSDVRP